MRRRRRFCGDATRSESAAALAAGGGDAPYASTPATPSACSCACSSLPLFRRDASARRAATSGPRSAAPPSSLPLGDDDELALDAHVC